MSPLSFGACIVHWQSSCTQNIILNCASWCWELCPSLPWPGSPGLKHTWTMEMTLLSPRISSPFSPHQLLIQDSELLQKLTLQHLNHELRPSDHKESSHCSSENVTSFQGNAWTFTSWNHNNYFLESLLIYSPPSDTDIELNPPCREKN